MNIWEDIKNRLNIVDVISEYVTVKSFGSTYKCVCPFHSEKNPSLIISPEKSIWHCFGCGSGGDIFKFVMLFENIDRKKALEILAKKAGVKLTKPSSKQLQTESEKDNSETQSTYNLGLKYLAWCGEAYHQVLLKILQNRENPITQYCLERGLTKEIIVRFSLGYAPKGNWLNQFASKNNLNLELLTEIGVLKKEENSQFRDKFTDRLMIPVQDRQGQIVGFTGRVLPYDTSERPKYLNSPQNIWFNKSTLWFGWHLHSQNIKQKKSAIIVEGNMDVIAANQVGINNTLASQGTSFTIDQLKILKQITSIVYLAFDNDNAGQVSGNKFFKEATKLGFSVEKVLIPKEYKDLDEWTKKTDANLAEKLPKMPFLDYLLESKYLQLQSSDSQLQKKTILECLDLMSVLDVLTLEQYLQKLSSICKISVNTLQQLVVSNKQKTEIETDPAQISKAVSIEQVLLVRLQNLVASTLKQSSIPEKFDLIFLLLKNLLPQIQEYTDLQEYIQKNQEELEIVLQNIPDITKAEKIQENQAILERFIDQNIQRIFLDNHLKQVYSKLKAG